MNESNHPKWVELDALFLGDKNEQAALHVAGCMLCSKYLASLGESPIGFPHPSLPQREKGGWRFLAAAAAFAALVLTVWSGSEQTRAKSTPAVSVYTKHQERIELWDGKTPFQSGDAIRFEIFSGAMKSVAVLSRPVGEEPTLLYQGNLSAEPTTLLPLSFSFDEAPEPENVAVVLSAQSLDPATLQNIARHERRDPSVWVTHLQFPKTKKAAQ